MGQGGSEGGGAGTEVVPRYQILRECDGSGFGFGRILQEEVAWNRLSYVLEFHGPTVGEGELSIVFQHAREGRERNEERYLLQ